MIEEKINNKIIKRGIAIGLGDDYFRVNLLIDKVNGQAIGIDLNNEFSVSELKSLMNGDFNEFKDTFYIESLWDEFVEVPTIEDMLLNTFHIWGKGTRISEIKEWFDKNYSKNSYDLQEYNPHPLLVERE